MSLLIRLASNFFFLFASLLLIHCGGSGSTSGSSSSGGSSGGSTDISGLAIGQQVALVTAKSSSGTPSISKLASKAATDAETDYSTDTPEIYVFDESMEALNIVNEILCYFDQTGYASMVNQGSYIAMVNGTLCNKDRSGGENNQSSSQNQACFEEWILNVTRESEDDPQIVNAWIPESSDCSDSEGENEPFEEIRAVVTITEAASSTNPFGVFSMDFYGLTEGELSMRGNLSSSNTDVNFINLQFNMTGTIFGEEFSEKVNAILTPGEDEGVAYTSRSFPSSMFGQEGGEEEGEAEASPASSTYTETVQVAFNSDNVLESFNENGTQRNVCLSRSSYTENVWRYNLYDADTGARKELNGGVGIKSNGKYGWADYYGIWFPQEISVTDGMEVTDDDGEVTYTVSVGKGRLIRLTKQELTLGDFLPDTDNDGSPDVGGVATFEYWDDATGANIQLQWNGTEFKSVGTMTCGENGCSFESSTPTAFEFDENEWIGLWLEGVGRLDLVADSSGNFSNSTKAPLYTESFVESDDAIFDGQTEFTLRCTYNCIGAGLSATQWDNGNIFLAELNFDQPGNEAYSYSFDADSYSLQYNAADVGLASGQTPTQNGPYSWGARMNGLVTNTVYEALDNPWEIWDQDTIYEYETGPNSWNKDISLLDSSGNSVVFDAPLQCLYTHTDGSTYFLDYAGPGQLWGIPMDESTNGDFSHWVAAFSIANGATLSCGGTNYLVKQMELEQFPNEDEDGCGDLQTGNISEPDNELPDSDGIPEASPTVTDAPAFIGGTAQSS